MPSALRSGLCGEITFHRVRQQSGMICSRSTELRQIRASWKEQVLLLNNLGHSPLHSRDIARKDRFLLIQSQKHQALCFMMLYANCGIKFVHCNSSPPSFSRVFAPLSAGNLMRKCIKFLGIACIHASNSQDFDAYMQVSDLA